MGSSPKTEKKHKTAAVKTATDDWNKQWTSCASIVYKCLQCLQVVAGGGSVGRWLRMGKCGERVVGRGWIVRVCVWSLFFFFVQCFQLCLFVDCCFHLLSREVGWVILCFWFCSWLACCLPSWCICSLFTWMNSGLKHHWYHEYKNEHSWFWCSIIKHA